MDTVLLILGLCLVALLAAGVLLAASCQINGHRLDDALRRDGESDA